MMTSCDLIFNYAHGWQWIEDDKARLADLLVNKGDCIAWVYDLGLRWELTIKLLDVQDRPPQGERYTQVLDGCGACPPEDANGADPDHTMLMCTAAKLGAAVGPNSTAILPDELYGHVCMCACFYIC